MVTAPTTKLYCCLLIICSIMIITFHMYHQTLFYPSSDCVGQHAFIWCHIHPLPEAPSSLSLSSPPRNDPRANERNKGGKRAPFEKKLTSPSPSPQRRARPPDRRSRTTLCRRRPPPPRNARADASASSADARPRDAPDAGRGRRDPARRGRGRRRRRGPRGPPLPRPTAPRLPPRPPCCRRRRRRRRWSRGGGEDKCDKRRITCAR